MKLFIVMGFMEYSSSFFSSELYDFTTSSSYKNLASLRILTKTFNLWVKRLDIRVSQIMMLLLDLGVDIDRLRFSSFGTKLSIEAL